jgi:hypothetical protein
MNNFVSGGPNIPQAGRGGSNFGRNLAAMALGFMGTRNRMLEDQQRNINDLALHMSKREVTDTADKEMGNHWITAAVHGDKTFKDAGMAGLESINAGGVRAQTIYKGNTPNPDKETKATSAKPETTDTAPQSSTESPQPVTKPKKERAASFANASAAVRGGHIDTEQAIDMSPTYAKKFASFHSTNEVRKQSGQAPRKSKNFQNVNANLNGNSDSTNGNKG